MVTLWEHDENTHNTGDKSGVSSPFFKGNPWENMQKFHTKGLWANICLWVKSIFGTNTHVGFYQVLLSRWTWVKHRTTHSTHSSFFGLVYEFSPTRSTFLGKLRICPHFIVTLSIDTLTTHSKHEVSTMGIFTHLQRCFAWEVCLTSCRGLTQTGPWALQ